MRPINESVMHVIFEEALDGGTRPEAQRPQRRQLDKGITYTSNPTHDQLADAADLVDSGGQMVINMSAERFQRNTLNVLALDGDKVVGMASIKPKEGRVAEVGYLMVDPQYRRKGIDRQLFKEQMKATDRLSLDLVYASIRVNNAIARATARRHGMLHAGDKKSPYSSNILSYYVYPIRMDDQEAIEWAEQNWGLNEDEEDDDDYGW